jgi:hypothetical protein
MTDSYSLAIIQAQHLWPWEAESVVKGVVISRIGSTMAVLRRIGYSVEGTIATVLCPPVNGITSRRGTGDISSRIEDTLRQLDLQQVRFSGLAQIRNYLLQNSDLLDLLPSLCRTVLETFEPSTKLQLEYYQDPQFENDQYLCLYLRTEAVDVSIVGKIDGITEAYSEALANAKGWILVTPDFRPL